MIEMAAGIFWFQQLRKVKKQGIQYNQGWRHGKR
jgi:phage protein U